MDALFHGYLVSNGFSATGALQIIQELVVTDPKDRKIIYEFLRVHSSRIKQCAKIEVLSARTLMRVRATGGGPLPRR